MVLHALQRLRLPLLLAHVRSIGAISCQGDISGFAGTAYPAQRLGLLLLYAHSYGAFYTIDWVRTLRRCGHLGQCAFLCGT